MRSEDCVSGLSRVIPLQAKPARRQAADDAAAGRQQRDQAGLQGVVDVRAPEEWPGRGSQGVVQLRPPCWSPLPASMPRRMTTIRTATARISRRLCEMKITALPCPLSAGRSARPHFAIPPPRGTIGPTAAQPILDLVTLTDIHVSIAARDEIISARFVPVGAPMPFTSKKRVCRRRAGIEWPQPTYGPSQDTPDKEELPWNTESSDGRT